MEHAINWGIMGTGFIAGKFAEALQQLPGAKLMAVGSRRAAAAEDFGFKHSVPKRHASYEALAADPDVHAVYIATPHSCHRENALLCLAAGKAVLCEKPFTINASEAAEVIEYARQQKLLLMEAMWSRFLPIMAKVRHLLADKVIGEPRLVAADFGFHREFDRWSRLFNPELGGGALLDVGVYPVSLASMIFGAPTTVLARSHLGETGVDEQTALILGHAGGQLASLFTAVRTTTFQEAAIMGTKGRIKLNSPWWKGTTLTLMRDNDKDDFIETPFDGNGYQYQAVEFMRLFREGKTESDIMPLDETHSIMKTLDTARAQMGVKYPMEASRE